MYQYILIFLNKIMINIKLVVGFKLSKLGVNANKLIYKPNGFKPFMTIQGDIVNRLQGFETYKFRLVHRLININLHNEKHTF